MRWTSFTSFICTLKAFRSPPVSTPVNFPFDFSKTNSISVLFYGAIGSNPLKQLSWFTSLQNGIKPDQPLSMHVDCFANICPLTAEICCSRAILFALNRFQCWIVQWRWIIMQSHDELPTNRVQKANNQVNAHLHRRWRGWFSIKSLWV